MPQRGAEEKEQGRQLRNQWEALKTLGKTKANHDFPLRPAAGPEGHYENLTV